MLPENTILGELRYREIYEEYNGPQLFSAENAEGCVFFVMHAPTNSAGDKWLWKHISSSRLKDAEENKIDLASIFSEDLSRDVSVYVVTVLKAVAAVRLTTISSLPGDWLPLPGVYLCEDEEEVDLDDQIWLSSNSPLNSGEIEFDAGGLDEEIYDIPTPLWRGMVADPDVIAALRVSPVEAAQHSHRIVCDFVIQPGRARTDVGAAALGNLLIKTQRMMDTFGAGPTPPPPNSAAARSLRARTELRAVAHFPGSFGLRLEAAMGSTVPDESLVSAFRSFLALLSAGKNVAEVRELLRPLGRRAAVQYRDFAKSLVQISGDFVVEVGIPGIYSAEKSAIETGEVAQLAAMLDAERLDEIREDEFFGYLMGASLRKKLFLLENSDQSISGRIADEALNFMQNRELGALHKAQIRTIFELNETTGEETERHILLSIEPTKEKT